ncbi:MAG: triacylglycerol lipase [Clostridiaceae bacterium]|nr:triacylglycerol lipase [Clostridiaceae bacterium]
MSIIRRLFHLVFLLVFSYVYVIPLSLHCSPVIHVLVVGLSVVYFIIFNITPRWKCRFYSRAEVLMDGRELIIFAFFLTIADLVFAIFFLPKIISEPAGIILNLFGALILLFIVALNGVLRIIFASTQLSLIMKLLLFFAWWVPLMNIIVSGHACRVARHEYLFLLYKKELNESRRDTDICKTKYPLLMVHGIFWRDWQIFNYWGRISKELIRNGATVYYGNQQSAAPMNVCAAELKTQILRILDAEQCEKVNIIAHSKGGLDARYAISRAGAAPYVASLTTVGTPHLGCRLVDIIVRKIPDLLMQKIAKGYNAMYKKLGDAEPDLMSGISDLTTEQCALFNQEVLDREGIYYSSIASKMSSFFSAGFPLNVGYALLRYTDGENDGFVSVESSKWGAFLGSYETKRRRGVSHGDMIDLTRKNIPGFDACECYVDILKNLKARGL